MRKPHEITLSEYLLQDSNPTIRFLILSDVVLQGSAGLLAPIFALFVDGFIVTNDTLAVAGVAAAIYLIVKSLAQIPAAAVVDRIPGEKDDFQVLFWSSIIMGLLPLSYLVIHLPWQLYIVQGVIGLATAFSFPSYMAIFTRHIDKKREGTEWGIYFTLTDLSAAATAAIGGILASTMGFYELILGLVGMNLVGALLIFPIKKFMRPPRK